ncbi:hypothetical protein VDG1235_375 [Verrucomicrobiia bacterium DG1235]|nr:hypothetical protein VDG1235_375 [Verrucomicrobiae bacterium DG1235]
MRIYLKAVIGTKLLDYLVFSVLIVAFEVDLLLAVLSVTLVIPVIRFLFARKALIS